MGTLRQALELLMHPGERGENTDADAADVLGIELIDLRDALAPLHDDEPSALVAVVDAKDGAWTWTPAHRLTLEDVISSASQRVDLDSPIEPKPLPGEEGVYTVVVRTTNPNGSRALEYLRDGVRAAQQVRALRARGEMAELRRRIHGESVAVFVPDDVP